MQTPVRVLIATFAGFFLCASLAFGGPDAHLRVQFAANAQVPEAVRRIALAEATRLWQPYAVAIEQPPPGARCDDETIPIVFDVSDPTHARDGTLGEIGFGSDGLPKRLITLYYRAIEKLATTTQALGADASRWPAVLRNQAIGRTTGRALAHEIGHYVLRWPHHDDSGLMRAEQRASTFADIDGRAFVLSPNDQLRLAVVRHASPSFTLPHARPALHRIAAQDAGCALLAANPH